MQQKYREYRQVAAETVLDKSGTQTLRTYIESRQATEVKLVALCPIFRVCDRETGGPGRHQETLWRQTTAEISLVLRYNIFRRRQWSGVGNVAGMARPEEETGT